MKIICGDKRTKSEGKGKQNFISGVVRETKENVLKWLSASHLTELTARDTLGKNEPYKLTFRQYPGGGKVTIFSAEQDAMPSPFQRRAIGESIIYERQEDYTLEAWATDVSLLLLYLAANYGGGEFAEAVNRFLTEDKDGFKGLI